MTSRRGAYGFRLAYPDIPHHPPDLIELEPGMPLVTVMWRHASTVRYIEEVSPDHVTYGFRGDVTHHAQRDPPSITIDLPTPPILETLVHPFLTVGISVFARWRGDVTLHAGAFETPSGAWGVMGERLAGKSSILASIAERGYPVVADDLLAISGRSVWAGPSCVDLRSDAVEHFDRARYVGVVGRQHRYRLSARPGSTRAPLRGFFILEWNEGPVVLDPLPADQRLRWLYRQEYIRLVGQPDPPKLVPIIGLPAWRLARPRDWGANEEAVEQVLTIANGFEPPGND